MMFRASCPAKLNIGLRVFGPDSRGYHPIETTFQSISLADTLFVDTAATHTEIQCSWDGFPVVNTLSRCLEEVGRYAEIPPLFVSLEKHIPAESGLGGGSSDAAGLLRVLRQVLSKPLEPEIEAEVGLKIGADVPFFLVGGAAQASGYGEVLHRLEEPTISGYILIAIPSVTVSTAVAFAELDRLGPGRLDLERSIPDPMNSFEAVCPEECHVIRRALRDAGAHLSMLSGSGSAVFGTFDTFVDAEVAQRHLAPVASWTQIVRPLTREESLWMSSS